MLTMALMMMLAQQPAAPTAVAAKAAEVVETKQEKAAPAVDHPAAVQLPATPGMSPVGGGPELLQVKTVYLLSMGKGLDQFLADRLTRGGVLQVVTDPAKADAIFTDQVGKGFERSMEQLYPKPKPPEPEKKKKDEDDEEKNDGGAPSFDVKGGATSGEKMISSFGKGKGTFFLVHRGTGNVVWSLYERPATRRADDLNETARVVVRELEASIKKTARKASGKAWYKF